MLKDISDQALCARLERLVRHERKVMASVIEYVAEMERRKLYLTLGYGSLFDYLTKKLLYSESSAYRRMQAARALLQTPEIRPRLEEGSLKLSQVCLVQKTLRQEEKTSGERISLQRRKEIFTEVAGKTGRETEKILDAHVNAPVEITARERLRRDESVELNLRVSKELHEKLRKVKELYAHIEPGADWLRVLDRMATDVLKKRDLSMKNPLTRPFAEMRAMPSLSRRRVRRSIPTEVKRKILLRDEGKCQFVGAGGRKCESRHQIEIDHIHPVAQGGTSEPHNLRILCRAHNAHRNRTGT